MKPLEKADTEFSRFIRQRDHRCMNPLCPNGLHYEAEWKQLDCSHYWPRGIWISRFDPDNCIALCRTCHRAWENSKTGKYKEIMIRLLGYRRFDSLRKRVENYKFKNTPHFTMNDAIAKCREFLTNQNASRNS